MTEPGRVEHNKPGQTRNGSGRISRTGSKKRGVGCVVTEWIGTAQGRGSVETGGVGTWALARRRRDLGFGAGCGTAASSGHDDNLWAETTTAGHDDNFWAARGRDDDGGSWAQQQQLLLEKKMRR